MILYLVFFVAGVLVGWLGGTFAVVYSMYKDGLFDEMFKEIKK